MNDFISRFNSFPLGQKVLFLVLLMIFMVVGFYFVHYQPHEDQMASLNVRLSKNLTDIEEQRLLKSNQEEVRERLEKLKRELLVAREQLPASAEIPSLLQRIHNQAKTAGLEINTFKRMSDVNQAYYTEIPVAMELIGSFDELANFFFYLGRLTRIVNVRDIKLEQAGKGEPGLLKVSALATTFMYNAAGSAAPGSKASPKK